MSTTETSAGIPQTPPEKKTPTRIYKVSAHSHGGTRLIRATSQAQALTFASSTSPPPTGEDQCST